jgi:hypothetical protein
VPEVTHPGRDHRDAEPVADIAALVEGTDPNSGGGELCATLTPQYGCLSSANRPARTDGALLGMLGVLGLAWARGRARR